MLSLRTIHDQAVLRRKQHGSVAPDAGLGLCACKTIAGLLARARSAVDCAHAALVVRRDEDETQFLRQAAACTIAHVAGYSLYPPLPGPRQLVPVRPAVSADTGKHGACSDTHQWGDQESGPPPAPLVSSLIAVYGRRSRMLDSCLRSRAPVCTVNDRNRIGADQPTAITAHRLTMRQAVYMLRTMLIPGVLASQAEGRSQGAASSGPDDGADCAAYRTHARPADPMPPCPAVQTYHRVPMLTVCSGRRRTSMRRGLRTCMSSANSVRLLSDLPHGFPSRSVSDELQGSCRAARTTHMSILSHIEGTTPSARLFCFGCCIVGTTDVQMRGMLPTRTNVRRIEISRTEDIADT